ncbi:MAG: cytochrome C, partial [Rubrivivax sp.]|nr:cytochrome C [Rubrivivax sp.]
MRILLLAWLAASALPALAQTVPAPQSRGALLYATHCIACHSTQMHWRDKRVATDWASLRAEVQRWQGHAQLRWSEDDITEVARYLNE